VAAPQPPPRRIGVVGDVHACDARLEQLVTFLQAQALDRIVCVGDIVNGPGDPDACAAILVGADALTVRGNHDRWLLEGRQPPVRNAHRLEDLQPATVAFLRALPASVELEAADGARLLLCHGLCDNDMNSITADDYGYALEANEELQGLLRSGERRIVIKGHRHRPCVWRVGELSFVDAGSLLADAKSSGAVLDVPARVVLPLVLTDAGVEVGDAQSL
jgi:predicted phosphodiesterase